MEDEALEVAGEVRQAADGPAAAMQPDQQRIGCSRLLRRVEAVRTNLFSRPRAISTTEFIGAGSMSSLIAVSSYWARAAGGDRV